jgi:hypothetical protein
MRYSMAFYELSNRASVKKMGEESTLIDMPVSMG